MNIHFHEEGTLQHPWCLNCPHRSNPTLCSSNITSYNHRPNHLYAQLHIPCLLCMPLFPVNSINPQVASNGPWVNLVLMLVSSVIILVQPWCWYLSPLQSELSCGNSHDLALVTCYSLMHPSDQLLGRGFSWLTLGSIGLTLLTTLWVAGIPSPIKPLIYSPVDFGS